MVAIKVAAAGLLIGAATASPYYAPPSNGTHYTTEVVTAITTYCPGATTLTYGDKTYTVTSETTLTITDCPCTVSYPVKPTKPVVPHPVYTTEVITAHPYPQPTPGKPGKPEYTAPAVPGKPTTAAPVPVPTGTATYPVPEGTNPAVVTAAAGRIAPAGVLAVLGAIALF
ncbi:Cell wall protein Sed1/Spi1 [Fusarium oxysporum f. sp. vasinfectum]|nr:Cell wall protein Sed1/Spi1 [Fusarium oxysporum f. sp. vasinfectum]KAK2928765.1 Cell wall protein Sed1/Spi1 [Fusarium oxysporum f. sp. vasinfectum]